MFLVYSTIRCYNLITNLSYMTDHLNPIETTPSEFAHWSREEIKRLVDIVLSGAVLKKMHSTLRQKNIMSPGNRRRIEFIVKSVMGMPDFELNTRLKKLVADYRETLDQMKKSEDSALKRLALDDDAAPLGYLHIEETGAVSQPAIKTEEPNSDDNQQSVDVDTKDFDKKSDETASKADLLMEGVPVRIDDNDTIRWSNEMMNLITTNATPQNIHDLPTGPISKK